jgi:uroporphyrinogen decarboxylase
MLYQRPDLMHRILDVNADAVAAYLNAQIDAGAQAVMVFDTWGGTLADGAFQRFSLAYTQRVVSQLKRERVEALPGGGSLKVRVPSIVFTKGGGLWLEQIAALGCDAVGLDWTVNLGQARARVGDRVALQGNLDPMVLFAEPKQIEAEVAKALESFGLPHTDAGQGAGHVFNLGHGISQFTPPDHVTALVQAVHDYSRAMRQR